MSPDKPRTRKRDPAVSKARRERREAELAQVVALRHAGKTAKETAAILGLTVATVQTRLAKAFARNLCQRLPHPRTKRVLTVEEVETVKTMWAAGEPVQQIARTLEWNSVSAAKFIRRLVSEGAIAARPADFRNKIKDEELRQLIVAGKSTREIAAHFGACVVSVYRRIHQLEKPFRKPMRMW